MLVWIFIEGQQHNAEQISNKKIKRTAPYQQLLKDSRLKESYVVKV